MTAMVPTRRNLLAQASMLAGLGGLPARRPDQQRTFPPTGTQPGSSSDTLIARTVIIYGNTGGLFIYIGQPGLGNPPVASITDASADPYGNPVNPLANFGYEAGAHFGIDINGNVYMANAAGTTTIYFSPTAGLAGWYPAGYTTGPAVVTIASAAGTGPDGRSYTEGLNVNQGDFEVDANGIRVYSGTPAANNLIFSASSAQYTDPYGNLVLPGQVAYLGGTPSTAVQAGGSFPGITLYGNLSGGQAGPWSTFSQMRLNTDSTWSGNAGEWIENTVGIPVVFQSGATGAGGAPAAAVAQPGTLNASEYWHPLPLVGGWTAVDTPMYRLTLEGTVEVFGSATHAAFTATTALSTALAAAYRPASNHNIAGSGVPPTTGSVYRASGEVSTAGIISAVPNGQSCTEVDLCGYYPLY